MAQCVGSNALGDVGANAIASQVECSPALAQLSLCTFPLLPRILGNNKIGDEGAEAIASAVGKSATLQILDLSDNVITSRGAAAIFGQGVGPSRSLQAIHLSTDSVSLPVESNKLDDKVVSHIVCALDRNLGLSVLDISNAIQSRTWIGKNQLSGKGQKEIRIAWGKGKRGDLELCIRFSHTK